MRKFQVLIALSLATGIGLLGVMAAAAQKSAKPAGGQMSGLLSGHVRSGNGPATCRKYYLHPLMLETYAAGKLTMKPATGRCRSSSQRLLSQQERCVFRLLSAASVS